MRDEGDEELKINFFLFFFLLFAAFIRSQSNPAEMNHTSDGFLNSILSEEDVQLMDMAINEGELF